MEAAMAEQQLHAVPGKQAWWRARLCVAPADLLPCQVQIRRAVLDGQRPAVPSRENLPGPDTATFGGLGAYTDLMR